MKMRGILGNDDFVYMKKLLNDLSLNRYNDDFFFELEIAFEAELNKEFRYSAERYINAFEEIKYRCPNKALNFIKKRISKMKYNDALECYNDEDHLSTGIQLFEEYINDNYMTDDIKLDCQVKLVSGLYKEGDISFKYGNYKGAYEDYEKALKIINSYWQIKDRFRELSSLKSKFGKTCEKLAIEKWNKYDYKKNNFLGCDKHININGFKPFDYKKYLDELFTNMQIAISYLQSAENFGIYLPLKKNLKLFYSLYKAYHESDYSNRVFYLYKAIDFAESGINCSDLYNKSEHIKVLKISIEQKIIKLTNLNRELNSINNDINNIQSLIDVKKQSISNKNNDMDSLNNLADSLISNSQEIITGNENVVNDGKKQLENTENNIKKKEIFVEQIKRLENEKKKDIENIKINNKWLKQKNDQLILILTNLESK